VNPLRLEFSGLYSYQTRQVLDFERLIPEGIFGIFGPVGSGKSSILEAILLALYGKVEKTNSRSEIINLQSNKLEVEFTFEHQGERYRSYFSVAKDKRGNVRKKETLFFRKNGENWENISSETTPEDVLGLSYENFKKTVIIPQGKFLEFLNL
jgi:exonuclease SbcC